MSEERAYNMRNGTETAKNGQQHISSDVPVRSA